MKPRLTGAVALLLFVSACGDGGGGAAGPDLEIERRTGYAVVVDDGPGSLEIGFSTDRDAESGEAFVVGDALWRIEDGPWNEPPVSCLGRGRRIEMGIARVQNESKPGLLEEWVVWISCLAPSEE